MSMRQLFTLLVWFGLVLSVLMLTGRTVIAAPLTPPAAAVTANAASSLLPQRVVAVDVYDRHSCALTADGKVWCWGDNFYGQLGDGTHQNTSVPVQATLLNASAVKIAVGYGYTCAVTVENRIVCWGDSYNTVQSRELTGITGTVTALAAGSYPCVLNDSGMVMCFQGSTPTIPIASGAVSISVGASHACAVMTDSRVWCWGGNSLGQLGEGVAEWQPTPVAVAHLPNTMVAVSAGRMYTCALSRDGRVWCWGYNEHGQLGDGTTTSRARPMVVADLPTDITSISTGSFHTCAVTASGSAWCWGNNFYGSLGNNDVHGLYTKPVAVTGITGGITALSAGYGHTCALMASGGVLCWGRNLEGQLGDGRVLQSTTARYSASVPSGVQAITAGHSHTCALAADGRVLCWGAKYDKNLCDMMFTARGVPTEVETLSGVTAVDAGNSHTCALTSAGGVVCWGGNYYGQAGNSSGRRSDPLPVTNLSSGVSAITAGEEHTCALKQNGDVVCWGHQWGATPTVIAGLPRDVRAITAGGFQTCALAADGSVYCWANGTSAEFSSDKMPMRVANLTGVRAIAAGGAHTCAVTATGGVVCWGANRSGQLGDGTTTDRTAPVAVNGLSTGVVALAAGDDHTCALTVDHQVKCWGNNDAGQLGVDAPTTSSEPVTVTGITGQVTALTAGTSHSCALLADGRAVCWGDNETGQLGLGDFPYRGFPMLMQLGLSQLYVPLVNR